MNFGLIVSKQHPPGVSMVDRFREHVDQVRAARDAGFDLIVMGQHYLSTPFQEMQTLPALARLAAEAGTMRVGATVILLPLLNPVDVAEQVATLDVITEGRFVFGVGLGYRDEENEAFGIAPGERVAALRRGPRGDQAPVGGGRGDASRALLPPDAGPHDAEARAAAAPAHLVRRQQ